MKTREEGYTLTEMLVSLSIVTMIAASALLVISQVSRGTGQNNDHMTAVRQVENAGYWIGRDTQTAQSISTDNLTLPDFLILNWTDWDTEGEPIYCSAKYFFEDMNNNIGKLKRSYWNSSGINEQALIAQHIFVDSDNDTYTSRISYVSPILSLKITSSYDGILESREYEIVRRPNY
ncbi:type II secretion system protein J [Chloroflexota bacterium]